MLFIKASARQSKVQGLGLFADELILSGTQVWGWVEESDWRFSQELWDTALKDMQNMEAFLWIYMWVGFDDYYYGTACIGRFTNHSTTPNVKWNEEKKMMVATRDIMVDEEITGNYQEFDKAWPSYEKELTTGTIRYKK